MMNMIDFAETMRRLECRCSTRAETRVDDIITEIRQGGSEAVRRWARKLDGFEGDSFEVPGTVIRQALNGLAPDLIRALREAAHRIRFMAERQRQLFEDLTFELDGVEMGHRVVPVEKVACYAPGGRYPLPSSVLMAVIPARVAGVKDICVLSPKVHPVTLAAAAIAGADRVFNIGGVQAVAAAALGLAGIPRADMVVGPGNRYVTEAKRVLYGETGIDFPAGPSELLIIADGDAPAEFLAADLLAQAEHDPDAFPAIVSQSRELLTRVQEEIDRQLTYLPRDSPAWTSISNGWMVQVDSLEQAVILADELAPEHLELVGSEAESLISELHNYGALFLGCLSAEVFGDYGSGTNHILPTGRAARFTGGLWVGSFLKIQSWQRVLPAGTQLMVDLSVRLADIEGLKAHAAAARLRQPR